MKSIFVSLVAGLLLIGLNEPAVAARKIKVTATIGMVADLVKDVGGDRVEVQALMGPGVDPHLYKASASDIQKLQQADIIFYNGLLLEGKMADIFSKMARTKKYVYAVTESIPQEDLLEPPEFDGHFDPHVWFDVRMWSRCAEGVARALTELDPSGKATYQKNAQEVRRRYEALHQWATERVAELPKEKRILITSHDAFNYFGRAYGFQVVGLQGISTVSDVSLADVAKMIDFIKSKKVKAIFVESSVPHKTIERISQDAGIVVGGELFSDAMGTPGEMENGYDLGTYEGMIRHNVNTVVNALK